MNQTRAITSNMLAILAGKSAVILLGLLTLGLLTRHLGASGFGQYRTVLTYLSFSSVWADLGLYMIALREISRPGADPSRILGNALALRLVATTGVLLAGAAFSLLLPYEAIVRQGILAGVIGYACYQGSELLLGVFQRELKQGQPAVAEVIGTALMFVLVFLFVRWNAGLLPMILAMVAAHAVTFSLSWLLADRLIPFRLCFDWQVWRRLAVDGYPLAISSILGLAILRGDTLLLSVLKPAADVGYYGVGSKIFEIVTTLPFLFAGLMMPMLSATALTDRPGFRRYLARAFEALAVSAVGLVAALLFFAGPVMRVIAGSEFDPGASALRILSAGMAVVFLSMILRFSLTALERQRLMVVADAVGLVVALVGYLSLIPPWSFNGAAVATLLAESTILALAAAFSVRAGAGFPWRPVVPKALLAGVCAFGVFFGLDRLGLLWIANLAVGEAVYVGVLLLLRAIPVAFLRDVFAGRGAV
jgi:O-antigen/teichoic acid export membrane protein